MDGLKIKKKFNIEPCIFKETYKRVSEAIKENSFNGIRPSGLQKLEKKPEDIKNKMALPTYFASVFSGNCYAEIDYIQEKSGSNLYYLDVNLFGGDEILLETMRDSINANLEGVVENA